MLLVRVSVSNIALSLYSCGYAATGPSKRIGRLLNYLCVDLCNFFLQTADSPQTVFSLSYLGGKTGVENKELRRSCMLHLHISAGLHLKAKALPSESSDRQECPL
jgi:hypothetical protein